MRPSNVCWLYAMGRIREAVEVCANSYSSCLEKMVEVANRYLKESGMGEIENAEPWNFYDKLIEAVSSKSPPGPESVKKRWVNARVYMIASIALLTALETLGILCAPVASAQQQR